MCGGDGPGSPEHAAGQAGQVPEGRGGEISGGDGHDGQQDNRGGDGCGNV